MSDIKLVETGDGGDFEMIGPDIVIIEGFQNMIYLGLFGGNKEENTREFESHEQRFDWWGNSALLQNDSSKQFNSNTERLLNNIALSSSSRLEIEQTVKDDLKFMRDLAEIEVEVFLTGVDRVLIEIKITEPGNLESTNFRYLWDSTKSELTNEIV